MAGDSSLINDLIDGLFKTLIRLLELNTVCRRPLEHLVVDLTILAFELNILLNYGNNMEVSNLN